MVFGFYRMVFNWKTASCVLLQTGSWDLLDLQRATCRLLSAPRGLMIDYTLIIYHLTDLLTECQAEIPVLNPMVFLTGCVYSDLLASAAVVHC